MRAVVVLGLVCLAFVTACDLGFRVITPEPNSLFRFGRGAENISLSVLIDFDEECFHSLDGSYMTMSHQNVEGPPMRVVKEFYSLIASYRGLHVFLLRLWNSEKKQIAESGGSFHVLNSAQIGFQMSHDSSISVCFDGHVQVVLELERLMDLRYYIVPFENSHKLHRHLKKALAVVLDHTHMRGRSFDLGVMVHEILGYEYALFNLLKQMVDAARWELVDHHHAHAAVGFYSSDFNKAMIFSMDGGGNDGTFNIYKAQVDSGIKLHQRLNFNLGSMYSFAATLMPEVTGHPGHEAYQKWISEQDVVYNTDDLRLPGTAMAYAALGEIRVDLLHAISGLTHFAVKSDDFVKALNLSPGQFLNNSYARDLAATVQYVFSHIITATIMETMSKLSRQEAASFDGIILTGGCAMNVKMNYDVWLAVKSHYPVFVPAAPHDGGVSLGAIWLHNPPEDEEDILTDPVNLGLAGPRLFDIETLRTVATSRGARRIDVRGVAELLAQGAIIGLARGGCEFGPRALGHRSLLAYPDKSDVKDRMNRLKHRAWFRPVAPIVHVDFMEQMFDIELHSPFMSFAPPLTKWALESFPAIAHVDGTARVQTCSEADDEWLATLLHHMQELRGAPVLANTSFNIKGKPILNTVAAALEVLDTETDLDYVVIEDYLFTRGVGTASQCSNAFGMPCNG